MDDLIYVLPTWLVGIVVVSITAGFAITGLAIVNRLVPPSVRAAHNDVGNSLNNVVTVVYAVILAFLVIAVWQDFGKANDIAQQEASSISDIYRNARGYPEPLQRRVREGLEAYMRLVIAEEWKLQSTGKASERTWQTLEALHKDILDFEPQTLRQQAVHREQLREVNELLDHRRDRLSIAAAGLQPVVWFVLVAGTALVIGFSWFFGTVNIRAHYAMTTVIGVAIGLVLFLIAILDYPFRGGVSIRPEAFEHVQGNLKRLSSDH
jgi:hypothetical protein